MATLFSQKSIDIIKTCHPDIQTVIFDIGSRMNCTPLEGIRTLEKQKDYFARGVSRTMDSKHLAQSDGFSHAIDIVPYPIIWPSERKASASSLELSTWITDHWKDMSRLYYFSGMVLECAYKNGIKLRHGGDWDGDLDLKDQSFYDLPHFELIE